MSKQPELNLPGAVERADGTTRFRVWAPRHRQVDVRIVDDDRPLIPLEYAGGGFFEAIVADLPQDARYFYRLNNGVDRPDPASRFQPQGVHGPSQVTRRAFPWTDASWRGLAWGDYVLYEVHIGTFSNAGTFAAMIEHLDDLVRLGVTALQLMPVAQFPGGRNWGYDGVHPYAPQDTYGGPTELKRLVDACHSRGLAVVLDVVYNHLGPEGNYLAEFGPYFTDRHRTPWGPAINFGGPASEAVRDFFIGNALYWLDEFHVDALRLDATHAIHDASSPHFLQDLADKIRDLGNRLGRSVHAIAESNANDPRVVRPVERGGYGVSAQLVDDFHRSLHALLTGERQGCYSDFGSLASFATAHRDGYVLKGQYSRYRDRAWGTAADDIPPDQFVAFAQCHDTVGNRPGGERLARLVGCEDLKLAAAATILSPCTPLLFMGEEYDEPAPFHYFTSHTDPRLAEAVRAGRVLEFAAYHWRSSPPDPQSPDTFARSRITRSLAQTGHHAELRGFYQALLSLRRKLPAIRQSAREQSQTEFLESQDVVMARRKADETEVCIFFHFGDRPVMIESNQPGGGPWTVVLDSADGRWHGPGRTSPDTWSPPAPLTLGPKSCLVLTRH